MRGCGATYLESWTKVPGSIGNGIARCVDCGPSERILDGSPGLGLGAIILTVLWPNTRRISKVEFWKWPTGDIRLDSVRTEFSSPISFMSKRVTPMQRSLPILTDADHIPSDAFDCIILTQTLQYVFEPRLAIRTLKRILKPKGVLLVTVPGIAQITRWDMEQWGEFWRFTTLSAQRLFTEAFPQECVRVESYGNVLSTIARLHGILANELRPEELDYKDRDYDVIISVRVVKPFDS